MSSKILYDISMLIEAEMPVYKGKDSKRPHFEVVSNHQSSDVYETDLTFNLHTGTHLDAPLHMIKDGEGFEYFGLENIYNHCIVYDLTFLDNCITAADIKKAERESDLEISSGEIVLFKTKNSLEERVLDFIFLAESGAEYLAEIGIRGVGIDTPGIERDQEGHPTHRKLLAAEIFILEGLLLKEVLPGEYQLLLVPLKLEGVEAAPARALLLEAEEKIK
jgi:arylformamidase